MPLEVGEDVSFERLGNVILHCRHEFANGNVVTQIKNEVRVKVGLRDHPVEVLLQAANNAVLLGPSQVIVDEAKERRVGLTPFGLGEQQFRALVQFSSDKGNATVSRGLGKGDIRVRAARSVFQSVGSEGVEWQMLQPATLHDLQRLSRKGGYRGKKVTVGVDVRRQNEVALRCASGRGSTGRRWSAGGRPGITSERQ